MSALLGTRIYPVTIPENKRTWPALTYQSITASQEFTIDAHRVSTKRIQFDSYASTYGDAKRVLDVIGRVLSAYAGTLPDGTRVLFAENSIETDFFESDGRDYRCICEYEFTYVTP